LTHNVLEAEQVIQRVGIMRDGRLIAVGRPGQLKGALNQQLRLKIAFVPDHPPTLPNGAAPHEVAPGHWHLLIDQEGAPAYLEAITHSSSVEDFQLSTATLEDLYLSLAAREER
jgi:ABC-2 type transport system ATP-binding protein